MFCTVTIKFHVSTLLTFSRFPDNNNNNNNSPQRLGKGARRVGNGRTSRDHPNNSIVDTNHITEKSNGHLRRQAVTQTSVKDHQLMLV